MKLNHVCAQLCKSDVKNLDAYLCLCAVPSDCVNNESNDEFTQSFSCDSTQFYASGPRF